MSLLLMNRINDNYQMAVTVHRELADLFWFISMPGYAMWNEYQYLDESLTQRRIKSYITSTYHAYTPDKLPKSANIAEPFIGGKNRKTLKQEDSWKIIREAFQVYQDWEEATLQEYQRVASELLSNGEVSTFNFVGEIIKDVKAELTFVTDKIIELCAHNWDMPQIVSEQPDYFERYKYLLETLLGKPEKFHHWNGAYDYNSRVLFKKDAEA